MKPHTPTDQLPAAMRSSLALLCALALVAVTCWSTPALAAAPADQQDDKQQEKQSDKQDDATQQPAGAGSDEGDAVADDPDALPNLDDLLDLPGASNRHDKSHAASGVADPNQAKLDRALGEEDISESFVIAIKRMADAADLLERASDPGLRTQRVQEEIIRRLDVLIEQAQQNQQQQSSSSSSSSSKQKQQSKPTKQQQAKQEGKKQERQGDSNENAQLPARRDGQLNDVLDAARAAWGSLPTRVRDVLREGSNDTFSSIYKRLTEEYYRKLAEDSSQQ